MATVPDGRDLLTVPSGLDVATTIRGAKAPVLVGPTELWWSTRTPDGPGSLGFRRVDDTTMEATAWGPGTSWLLEQAPRLLGAEDDPAGFRPEGELGRAWRRQPFLLARTDQLWDALVGAVLGQKVQGFHAIRSRRLLARRFGEPAPGPRRAQLLPSPATVAGLGYHQLHSLGIERKRAATLIRVAREMPRLERLDRSDPEMMLRRLQHVPGVGQWTAALVTAVTLGHADAVPVGDFHLPDNVAWLLAREPRATDERMLELLAPYAGHRWRVIRLAMLSGGGRATTPPRYGPRLSLVGHGIHRGR